ncbi:hypothetical protein G4P62_001090 [Nothobranchius furzeri]|uniref:Uncharacterized protein n=3 Tax=Nothobranchius TaxID=28779 RepID=A0A9D2YYS4_NOTFU|nr:hypothetical protein G4P62_001090 [Nothobranchius furzeri]
MARGTEPARTVMARTGSLLPSRRNPRLDSFLKRNTERGVYARIRTYEPCVVVSDTISKVYMHVVLSDERVYLTEFPPRTLTAAVSFRRVRDIQLVNDLPDFLSTKDRERCQHIRIIYIAEKSERKESDWFLRDKRGSLHPGAPPTRTASHCPIKTDNVEGKNVHVQWKKQELTPLWKSTRSASCPNPETLGLPHPPPRPPSSSPSEERRSALEGSQVARRFGSILAHLLRRDGPSSKEEGEEAELHLYAVSQTSRLYVHLQSSWSSFIIRSTLLLDPLYRQRSSASSDSISVERTSLLFNQLSLEILQDRISMENLYLLLQELRVAAHRNLILRRLFWRSSEMCDFLVQTLEDCLHGCQSFRGVYTTDQLLLSSLIVQTLAIMFRETEVEEARVKLLFAKKGALASRMLLALICDPQAEGQGAQPRSEVQALLTEYLDASCSLLFELLLLGHETSRCFSAENLVSVGWILGVLQPHPHLLSFMGYQVQQVVRVLSRLQRTSLSPVQSVLLFQRCRLLLACLQNNSLLAQHLRSNFREELRYFVTPLCAEEKLLPQYPISRATVGLIQQIQTHIRVQ